MHGIVQYLHTVKMGASAVGDFICTSRQRPQILASFAASLGLMCVGSVISWTSMGIPSLLASKEFKNLTIEQQSWIGSIVPLGALISSPFGGMSLDRFGRKHTMIFASVFLVLGWLLIGYSTCVEMLYIGRFITGLCNGLLALSPVVYISDVCESEIRGTVASFSQVMCSFGIVFSYVVGSQVTWQWLAISSAFIPFFFMISIMMVPDSPRFLLDIGDTDEAILSLCWLRGTTVVADVQDEINTIQKNAAEVKRQTTSCKKIFTKRFLKPILISMALLMFQQLAGFNAVLMYTLNIFQIAGTSINPNLSTICIGILLTIATIMSAIVTDLMGRRILLISSGIMMACSLGSLGAFFYLKMNNSVSLISIEWLPLTALLIYIGAYGLGEGPIPWLVMTEILPNPVVGVASGLCSSVHFIFGFFVAKYFQPLTVALGIDWMFWFFAIVCVFGVAFVFFVVPETKLKSLEEIQLFFGPRLSISLPALSRSSSIYKTFSNNNKETLK